jgi:RNA-binding protein Nova
MGQNPQLNLVIPNASCGCIIGKGGVTIRSFAEDSRAEIKLSPQGGMLPGVSERILSIAGRIDSILRAVALVATALSDDDDYEALVARQSTYTNCPGGTVLRREHSSPPKAKANNTFGSHRNDVSVSVMLALPDEHIGAVLGKSGRTISEIQVVTGARIKISDRGDFLEGTKNRKVILTGMEEGVRMAQSLLEQKIEANSSLES